MYIKGCKRVNRSAVHVTPFKNLNVLFSYEMELILYLVIFDLAHAEENTGNCKDMLQDYLTGQLSSALGAYQEEALRREF